MFPKYLAEGGPEQWENTVLTAEGNERIIAWHNATLRDGSGKAVGTLSSGEDITGRKGAESALIKSEQLFRLLAENAKDMIYRVRLHPGPAVEYISPSALALTGHAPEDFLSDGALAARLLPPSAMEAQEKSPKMKGNLGGPVTMPWRRGDGATVWLELVNHPVLNAAGKLVAVEGVGRDVTERRQVEDALRESEEKFRNLADQSPNMIFINVKDRVVYANRRCEELLGYGREELYSPDFDFLQLVAPECRNLVAEKYEVRLSGKDLSPYDFAVVGKNGRQIDAILSTRRISYGGETAMLGMITDITELKRSEKALKKSEEKYRELVENINDVIFSTDQYGVVTYISPAVEHILGFGPGDITGKKLTEFIHAEDMERAVADYGAALAGELRPSEYRLRTKTGDFRWVRTSSRPQLADGAPSGISGTLEDITERKQAEDALRESEEKFRNLAEQSPNMIFINVKGRVVYANHRWEEIMGYTREEFCSPGFDFLSVIAPEHRDAMREKYRKHLGEQDLTPDEHDVIAKDGKRIPVILSTTLIQYGGQSAILGTLTDITELKRSEEALKKTEEKYRELVENINDILFSTDLEGIITYISPAVERTMGLSPGEVTGKKYTEFIVAEDLERIQREFGKRLTGELHPSEYRMKTKTGEVRWVRISSRPILVNGTPSGLSGLIVDINEGKVAEEKIRASLKEKEVLLKEIHHRVKNNLQIISSLLSMQSRTVKDARTVDVLRESQNRVQTMALIHDRIYRSADLSRVDLREYITRLVNELYISYGVDPGRVSLNLDLEEVQMEIESAIPCGFIINELVSNSLKHAFPSGRRGALRISLSSGTDKTIRLSVSDDGAGLPRGFDFRKTESLGLQLVCGLVTQLRGTIEREGEKGTAFRIEFRLGDD